VLWHTKGGALRSYSYWGWAESCSVAPQRLTLSGLDDAPLPGTAKAQVTADLMVWDDGIEDSVSEASAVVNLKMHVPAHP